jgi:2-methylcitrate dehydratase PrpD
MFLNSSLARSSTDVPEQIVEIGKKSILDRFGLALAGSTSITAPPVRQYLKSLNCSDGKASIIGTGIKVPPRFAAFANGVAIHSDDYDDTALISVNIVHAAVPVLPPVFALCEAGRQTGKDLLLAFLVGVEAGSKIVQASPLATSRAASTLPEPSDHLAATGHISAASTLLP